MSLLDKSVNSKITKSIQKIASKKFANHKFQYSEKDIYGLTDLTTSKRVSNFKKISQLNTEHSAMMFDEGDFIVYKRKWCQEYGYICRPSDFMIF